MFSLKDFEGDPGFIYGGYQPVTTNRNFLDHYRNNFSNVYNWGYKGELANMIKQGQTPNLSFNDYMDTTYDPWAEFRKQSPQQRGENRGQFAPRTRWNIGG